MLPPPPSTTQITTSPRSHSHDNGYSYAIPSVVMSPETPSATVDPPSGCLLLWWTLTATGFV